MHGKSAPWSCSSVAARGMSGMSAALAFCADTLRKRLGCLPLARLTESRRCERPKEGERGRFATADFWYCSGIGGTDGNCGRCD